MVADLKSPAPGQHEEQLLRALEAERAGAPRRTADDALSEAFGAVPVVDRDGYVGVVGRSTTS
jgi:hypothetical protein